jgi:hypothetical protein
LEWIEGGRLRAGFLSGARADAASLPLPRPLYPTSAENQWYRFAAGQNMAHGCSLLEPRMLKTPTPHLHPKSHRLWWQIQFLVHPLGQGHHGKRWLCFCELHRQGDSADLFRNARGCQLRLGMHPLPGTPPSPREGLRPERRSVESSIRPKSFSGATGPGQQPLVPRS